MMDYRGICLIRINMESKIIYMDMKLKTVVIPLFHSDRKETRGQGGNDVCHNA